MLSLRRIPIGALIGLILTSLFLIAAILLLIPSTASIGAVLALGTITGAIFSHLTKLGIVVKDDGGLLFILAIVVFLLSGVTLLLHRKDLPVVGSYL